MSAQEIPLNEVGNAPRPQRSASTRGWVVAAVLLLAGLFLAGALNIKGRANERVALADETARLSVTTVAVGLPQPGPHTSELELPGTAQAYTESPIYARTTGYLVRWYKDIGARVEKGDLLADLDTPEVDQQLSQAQAAREQTAAALELARTSADRWRDLRRTDSVSQQELDQRISDHSQAQANLAAADANVRRLQQLESFKHVYAPFAGVITRRNVDIGALVNAGNTGTGRELFYLAQIDPLRVYVSVPEADAPTMRVGMPASIQVAEFPGSRFQGSVVRTANAIDQATRTLLTEVDVPNPSGRLLPGAYAVVHFNAPVSGRRLSVPSSAMLFRAEGPRVAVVGADNRIQLRPILIGRDFGASLEVVSGIRASDRVVQNPPDSLEDGQQVQVAADPSTGKQS
ncbi:MAG TPA: efflux RND transporter periplasmic adaptor subunit [Bryobacteraceae bacterium]|nr:efflux RND transporter periplasmic adaptor subunit [Bryobacteraceae bacterium]